MTFDLENWTYLFNESRYSDGLFLMVSTHLDLTSYFGRVYMFASRRKIHYAFDLNERITFVLLVHILLHMYSIVAYLESLQEQNFHFDTILRRKCN